jgi:RNA polymerase sigma factor (sigma-70 family)
VEASAIQAPAGLARHRVSIGLPLLRLRSDEQLVALFRAGSDEAFRAIHDRYRQRLFAYARQMLPGPRQDAEDVLQDVFVRAYSGLRASDRELALRAWLYRVAHNRCIDELRRPPQPIPDQLAALPLVGGDPFAEAEKRETLRRLIEDVRRLPEQQRSALLMRELSGMSYDELAGALSVSIPAVKSLLVRARVGLAKAAEARETACTSIRAELVVAHDRGVRPSGMVRRHLRDCDACRAFRGDVRGLSRQLAALTPAVLPAAGLAKLIGLFGLGGSAGAGSGAATGGGGVAAGGGAVAGGGAAATGAAGGVALAGGAVGTGGVLAAGGVLATGATHVATLLAAAVITAGGAVELGKTIAVPAAPHPHHHFVRSTASPRAAAPAASSAAATVAAVSGVTSAAATVAAVSGVTSAAASDVATAASAAAPVQRPRRNHRAPASSALPASLDHGTFGLTGTGAATPASDPATDPSATGSSDGATTGAVASGTTTGGTAPSGTAPATAGGSGTTSAGSGGPVATAASTSSTTGPTTAASGPSSGTGSSSGGATATNGPGGGTSSGGSPVSPS